MVKDLYASFYSGFSDILYHPARRLFAFYRCASWLNNHIRHISSIENLNGLNSLCGERTLPPLFITDLAVFFIPPNSAAFVPSLGALCG